jgi:hypothetical protein
MRVAPLLQRSLAAFQHTGLALFLPCVPTLSSGDQRIVW